MTLLTEAEAAELPHTCTNCNRVAKRCYHFAEAMLVERQKHLG